MKRWKKEWLSIHMIPISDFSATKNRQQISKPDCQRVKNKHNSLWSIIFICGRQGYLNLIASCLFDLGNYIERWNVSREFICLNILFLQLPLIVFHFDSIPLKFVFSCSNLCLSCQRFILSTLISFVHIKQCFLSYSHSFYLFCIGWLLIKPFSS